MRATLTWRDVGPYARVEAVRPECLADAVDGIHVEAVHPDDARGVHLVVPGDEAPLAHGAQERAGADPEVNALLVEDAFSLP